MPRDDQCRYWEVERREVLSLIPATGFTAVYASGGEAELDPVIAWGVVRVKCRKFRHLKTDPAGTRGSEYGDPDTYHAVESLVLLDRSTGCLESALEVPDFVGTCPASDDPRVVFADEIAKTKPPVKAADVILGTSTLSIADDEMQIRGYKYQECRWSGPALSDSQRRTRGTRARVLPLRRVDLPRLPRGVRFRLERRGKRPATGGLTPPT